MVRCPGVGVHAIGIDLPYFDDGISDRLTGGACDLARQLNDLANSRRYEITDYQQVVISIQWHVVRIERPFSRPGGAFKFLGKQARVP